jgi:hypothetical protein
MDKQDCRESHGGDAEPLFVAVVDAADAPPHIKAALSYLNMVFEHTDKKVVVAATSGRIRHSVVLNELHPAQEGLLRIACNALGKYLASGG